MKLSEAWVRLAEAFAHEDQREVFLCFMLEYPNDFSCTVPLEIRRAMHARIMRDIHEDVSDEGWLTSCTPAYDDADDVESEREARVLACLMFAWEAEDAEIAQVIDDESEIPT